MSVFYQKLTIPEGQSFVVEEYQNIDFDYPYHYHSELEIILIVKGKGKQYVGENISSYDDGSLILVGKNLPHGWKSEKHHKTEHPDDHIALVQFGEECFGKEFFLIPEMKLIASLFKNAQQGINIIGETRKVISEKLLSLIKKKNVAAITTLLEMLDIIAHSKEMEIIARTFLPDLNVQDQNKMNIIFRYIFENIADEIRLEKAASLINMSKSAFCHYFFKRTGRNFSLVVNEMRIKNACRLLTETNHSVTEICYMNGYNSLSNFNKQFRKITQTTPLNYRKEFLK